MIHVYRKLTNGLKIGYVGDNGILLNDILRQKGHFEFIADSYLRILALVSRTYKAIYNIGNIQNLPEDYKALIAIRWMLLNTDKYFTVNVNSCSAKVLRDLFTEFKDKTFGILLMHSDIPVEVDCRFELEDGEVFTNSTDLFFKMQEDRE